MNELEPKRGRSQAGFTLIEVMIAMLLTALTVIGVLGLYRVESRASSFSRRETEAAVLAQDKLEELRTGAAPSANSLTTAPVTDELTGTAIFTRTWEITASVSNPALYEIRVRVEWDDNGEAHYVEVR
ncbi:MAG TPA: prepilin-type N-terminal cleavage/methylation domain-containing protein, partial [Kofleriaceae bacterium]